MYDPLSLFLAAVATCVGGVVRGLTGFAGPMIMLPVMTLLFGPVAGVASSVAMLFGWRYRRVLNAFQLTGIGALSGALLGSAYIGSIVPIYLVSTYCGSRLFRRIDETLFRRTVLIVLICLSIGGLVFSGS